MSGIERIAAERWRQTEVKNWSSRHDAEWTDGELVMAAISYAFTANYGSSQTVVDKHWPWDASWWKPSDDPIRNLEKAGALIAAEIDRLERLAHHQPEEA